MRNSLKSASCWALTRLLPLLLLTLSAIGLSACSTVQHPVGQATVAPQQPPEKPILPRPPALNLREFHVDIQPAVAGKPPLVTLAPSDYDSILQDLGDVAVRLCQDSWLLDYYEGKNNGVKPADWCALPPLTLPPAK